MISERIPEPDAMPINEICGSLRKGFDIDFISTVAIINGAIAKELSFMSENDWRRIVAVMTTPDGAPHAPDINQNVSLQWLRSLRKWGREEKKETNA